MHSVDTLAGTLLQLDEPDWGPLVTLVGAELASWFMWMGAIALADGAVVQAYKHIDTRRYLHLAADGRAFVYTPRGRYQETTRQDAIEEAFHRWESFLFESDEPELLRAALQRALRRLDGREP